VRRRKQKKKAKKKIFCSGDEQEKEDNDKEVEDEHDKTGEENDESMELGSPKPGSSRDAEQRQDEVEETAGNLEPSALAPVREEPPSQPTGVRIDGNKLIAVHNEIVRVTEGFNIEKLERSYAILAKVVREYKKKFDRTNLPTDLQAEIDGIKLQERIPEHIARIRR